MASRLLDNVVKLLPRLTEAAAGQNPYRVSCGQHVHGVDDWHSISIEAHQNMATGAWVVIVDAAEPKGLWLDNAGHGASLQAAIDDLQAKLQAYQERQKGNS